MEGLFNRLLIGASGKTDGGESSGNTAASGEETPSSAESNSQPVAWSDLSASEQPPRADIDQKPVETEPTTDSALPSEYFELAEEYRQLSATEAQVELQERTKELGAITRANELFGELDEPVDELIKTYATELPQWFQYPNVTEAKLVAGDAQATSQEYESTAQPLRHSTRTDSGTEIVMEIVYTEPRPEEDDGPWLNEEHDLVDTLMSFITNYCNQWEKQAQIEAELERQQAVAVEVEAGVEEARKTADSVSQSAEEIADHAHRSSDSMTEVANETEDMSATVEEIASTAEEVAMMSGKAEELAVEGGEAAGDAIDVMDRIDDATQEVTEDVDDLQSRINKIDEIVEVINDIADQTNILALNASIEAARAGEAGSGFAVVADEVKSLAGESQDHATEIERLIEAIKGDADETVQSLAETTREVDTGVEQVESAMTTLEAIETAVKEASDGIREVSDATDDQAASTEEVASMIHELVEESESVAAEIQSVAAANEQQVQQVESIESTVSELVDE